MSDYTVNALRNAVYELVGDAGNQEFPEHPWSRISDTDRRRIICAARELHEATLALSCLPENPARDKVIRRAKQAFYLACTVVGIDVEDALCGAL